MKTILEKFTGATEEKSLEQKERKLYIQFCNMAKELLYGGYFLIDEKKKIFLDDIEFYYHEEGDEHEGKLKDLAMYHTNDHEGRERNTKLPYFKIGRLNLHQSGVDVTFENEEKSYRASFLIRGFHVDGMEYDSHSLHIYDKMLYMGIPIGNPIEIEWITEDLPGKDSYIPNGFPRVNIAAEYEFMPYKNGNGGNIKKKETDIYPDPLDPVKFFKSNKLVYKRCQRSWRFFKTDIPNIRL